jgi:hypothetical protein
VDGTNKNVDAAFASEAGWMVETIRTRSQVLQKRLVVRVLTGKRLRDGGAANSIVLSHTRQVSRQSTIIGSS